MTRRVEVLTVPTKAFDLMTTYLKRECWEPLVQVALNASTGTEQVIRRELRLCAGELVDDRDAAAMEIVKQLHASLKGTYPEIHRLTFSYRVVEVEINRRDLYIVMTKTTNSGASNG